MGDWAELKQELALWRRNGLALPLWWRDDDATEPSDALDQLSAMAGDLGLPVHLAVIPEPATPALAARCRDDAGIVPLVHGWAHRNHAPVGQKKSEFGHPRPGANAEIAAGLARMTTLFGQGFAPVFVPPWNRLADAIRDELPNLGFTAVSTFTPRQAAEPLPGLTQINTHIDPINWRGGGGLRPEADILATLLQTLQDRRAGHTDATEPLGFLSHHLVHDPPIWQFTRTCLATLLDGGAEPCNLMSLKEPPA